MAKKSVQVEVPEEIGSPKVAESVPAAQDDPGYIAFESGQTEIKATPASYGFSRYLVVTQNPTYTGKVFGVPIANGIGILDPATLDPKLGHTLTGVVGELRQWPGYNVTELVGDPMTAIRTVREDQASKEAGEVAILKMLSDANIASKVREYLEAKG